MANIPYQGVPQVEPSGRGAPMPQSTPVGGFDALARGTEQFAAAGGNAAGQAAKDYAAEQEKARQKALAADVTDGETEFTKRKTQRLNGSTGSGNDATDAIEQAFSGVPQKQDGFLSLQGRAAAASSADVMKALEQDRVDIAKGMNDEDARKLFLARTGGSLEDARHSVAVHVSQQRRVADLASLQARKDAALEAIRANLGNSQEIDRQVTALEGPIKALSLSPEDARADLAKWNQDVIITQLDAYREKGDWQGLERALNSDVKQILGKKAEPYIEVVKHERLQVDANDAAQSAVNASIGEDKRVDATALDDELAKVPPELQKAARAMAYETATHRNAGQDKRDQQMVKEIWAVKNKVGWGATPRALKDHLNKIDPRLFDSFEDESYRRWKALQGSKADQAKAQAEYDRNALLDYQLSGENAQERVKQPLDQFLMRYPGLSEHGAKQIELKAQGDSGIVNKGLATSEQQFMRDVKSNGQGFIKGKSAQKEYEAEAGIAFEQQLRENQGKPVTQEQALRIIGQLTEKHVKKGIIFDSEELGYQQRRRRREEQQKAATGATVLPELDFSEAKPAAKPTYSERVRQLKAAGKTKDEARQILQREGY